MNHTRSAGVLAAALFCSCALGQGPRSVPVAVGGTSIALAIPNGFSPVTPAAGELATLGGKFTPQSNQLLAHFVRTSDLQRKARGRDVVFGRYFVVQATRAKEVKDVTPDVFKQVRGLLRKQQSDLLKKLEPALAQRIEQAKAKDFDVLASLKAGEFAPVGVYLDSDRAFASGTLSRLQYNEGSYAADHLMVTVTSVVALKERMLFLYTYAGFRGAEDMDWARGAALSWIKELQALNP